MIRNSVYNLSKPKSKKFSRRYGTFGRKPIFSKKGEKEIVSYIPDLAKISHGTNCLISFRIRRLTKPAKNI